jgi:hypothetical protein
MCSVGLKVSHFYTDGLPYAAEGPQRMVIQWYRFVDPWFSQHVPTMFPIKDHNWFVVWNMTFIFHFTYGMSSFQLTNSYVSRWLLHHQPDKISYKTRSNHQFSHRVDLTPGQSGKATRPCSTWRIQTVMRGVPCYRKFTQNTIRSRIDESGWIIVTSRLVRGCKGFFYPHGKPYFSIFQLCSASWNFNQKEIDRRDVSFAFFLLDIPSGNLT